MRLTVLSLLPALAAVPILASGTAQAQSFSLDDNPTAPLLGPPGVGCGAEDPFGVLGVCVPGLAPSPSVAIAPLGDGSIFAPGPVVQQPGPDGFYVDSLSIDKQDLGLPVDLLFSVDRLSFGAAGAVAVESGFSQQPADIYRSTDSFLSPSTFVGSLGAGPFAGALPAPLGGLSSNVLSIDESAFGLVAGGAILPPGVPAPPIGFGTHDNVDGFDITLVDANGDGLFDKFSYFSIYPSEALAVGTSAADIYDVAAGSAGTAPVPYAPSLAMGLDFFGFNTDSIDALVLFDMGALGGPVNGGPGAEPARDYALFSLAPGSASLAAFGLSPADIFFTDFTGAFGLYAPAAALGLLPTDNIDALDVVPEPTSALLIGLGMAGLAIGRRRRAR